MSYIYAVLGAGRQGTAAAYDMARHGDAHKVMLADANEEAAVRSAARINRLIGKDVAEGFRLDVTDRDSLIPFLEPADSFLSAVPYWLNPRITAAAIEARAHMTDLGGKTDLVLEQMKLDGEARKAGVSIIPDCGQVPGMGTCLMCYAMTRLDEADEVMMWDGGNDQNPRPPFRYILTFNIAGLTNEYYGTAHFLLDGKRVEVPTFREQDYETVDFPEPIGRMEAFVAGGGTSTMPWTFEGRLKTLWNKTLRWPGHFAQWKAYMDAGLLEEEPVDVSGVKVSPRGLFHALMAPKIYAGPQDRDLVIVRVLARGVKDGRKAEFLLTLIDRFDEATAFTAMERTTGWDASIKSIMNAKGVTQAGVVPAETSVPPAAYVDELGIRGFRITEKLTLL